MPWILFQLLNWLVQVLERLVEMLSPPPLTLVRKSMGMVDSHIVWLCCNLNFVEMLGKHKMSVADLAQKSGLETEACMRLLRAAFQIGLFKLEKRGSQWLVSNNRLSAALDSSNPICVKAWVLTHEHHLPAFLHFEHSLRTAHLSSAPTAFALQYGLEMWDLYKKDPHLMTKFSQGMKAVDALGQVVATDYNWGQYKRIVDIGAGPGSFLAEILSANQTSTQGLICDLPAVISEAKTEWEKDPHLKSLRPRVGFSVIDFLEMGTLPPAEDGDCYLMRHILHDWNDEKSRAILRNVRAAIAGAKARVAIVEMSILDESRNLQTLSSTKLDLLMMTCLKGKERTKEQLSQLFADTGFKLVDVVRTTSPFCVSIAEPVPQPRAFSVPKSA